jgi:diguanylate cyclase (GGDEF)-like protein
VFESLKERGRSLTTMLACCAVFACVAVAALFSLNVLYERQTAIDVARRAGSNLAQSLARQASDAFSATDCALLGLAERVDAERAAGNGGLGRAARERLQKWMAMQVMMVPRMRELVVVDERGNSEVSNLSAIAGPQKYLPQVAYLRAHPETMVDISEAKTNAGNAWVILDSRRVERADGSFAGAVIAQIETGYFEQIYSSVDVGRLGTIALVMDGGKVLVRAPQLSFGRRSLDAPPAKGDDVRRLVSYRRLDGYPLTMVVGIAEREYLAGWRSAALFNGIALVLVFTAIGLLSAGLRLQIRRRSRAEARLAQLALVDGLTGLANRRQFDVVLEREWDRARRDRTPLALLMIDVDNFKAYNDRYGHVQGDKALIAIAQSLSAALLRKDDLAARYGGEEFAVILPATGIRDALALGERMRLAVVALDVAHADGRDSIVTISVGVAALAPAPTEALSVLVQIADKALYDAKRAGRNRTAVVPAGVEMSEN